MGSYSIFLQLLLDVSTVGSELNLVVFQTGDLLFSHEESKNLNIYFLSISKQSERILSTRFRTCRIPFRFSGFSSGVVYLSIL